MTDATAASARVGLEAGIVSGDARTLVAFLSAGLGFTLLSTHDFPLGTVWRLGSGDARCKVFEPSTTIQQDDADPWFGRAGFAYASLLVPDAQVAADRAEGAGAEVVVGVTAHRPGARYALIRDVEANVWELLEENGT